MSLENTERTAQQLSCDRMVTLLSVHRLKSENCSASFYLKTTPWLGFQTAPQENNAQQLSFRSSHTHKDFIYGIKG